MNWRLGPFGDHASLISRLVCAAAPIGALFCIAIYFASINSSVPHTQAKHASGTAGKHLMSAGEYAQAVSALRAAYDAAPTPALQLDLSRALLAAGDYNGALKLLASIADPQTAWVAKHIKAEALLRAGRFGEAASLGASLQFQHRADSRASLVLARALYALGDSDEAAREVALAIRNGGDSLGDAWLFRSRLALDENDMRTARAALERAREARAPASEIAVKEIEILIREGDIEAAKSALSAFAAELPASNRGVDVRVTYLLARIDTATGDFEAAARKARLVKPWLLTQPNGALFLAMIQEKAGDRAQAYAGLRASLAAAPDNGPLLKAFGDLLILENRYDEAKSVADRLIKIQPHAAFAQRFAINSARHEFDLILADAIAFAETPAKPVLNAAALAFGAETTMARHEAAAQAEAFSFLGGVIELNTGDEDDLRAAADGLALSSNAATLALAGELYLVLGEDLRARALFDRALQINPQSEAALKGRVRVDVREGDPKRSDALLTDIVRSAPAYLPARLLLARIRQSTGRRDTAISLLIPSTEAIIEDPDAALYYAHVMHDEGAHRLLQRFAKAFRVKQPAHRFTADILLQAGLLDEAAAAARANLIAAPESAERVMRYAGIMARLGRSNDAKRLLDELVRRSSDATEAKTLADKLGAFHKPDSDGLAENIVPDLIVARVAYSREPLNPNAAYRFGIALVAHGQASFGRRVLQEACFWGETAACATSNRGDS